MLCLLSGTLSILFEATGCEGNPRRGDRRLRQAPDESENVDKESQRRHRLDGQYPQVRYRLPILRMRLRRPLAVFDSCAGHPRAGACLPQSNRSPHAISCPLPTSERLASSFRAKCEKSKLTTIGGQSDILINCRAVINPEGFSNLL
jgi:hypothetical protein